jgi:hypothetical protein
MTGRDTNIDDSSLFGSGDALDFRIDNEKRAALMERSGIERIVVINAFAVGIVQEIVTPEVPNRDWGMAIFAL